MLSEKRRVADDIVNGFKEAGFVYLSGHGIPGDVIDDVYKKVRPWRVNLPASVRSTHVR